jgi:hypothetical protein
MILIDFRVNEEELLEDLEMDIPTVEYPLFVLTFFMMPVKIQINGNNIFDPPDQWAELPILNIASNGLVHVKSLKENISENYELPEGVGTFDFSLLKGGLVKINYNNGISSSVFIVTYNELLEAFQKFAEKVRAFLKERVPQLNEHPYWGPWLRGEKD